MINSSIFNNLHDFISIIVSRIINYPIDRTIPKVPQGTDLVGYETLIRFIVKNDILAVDGDFIEIGTFLGGGAYKLAKFLEQEGLTKKLFVVDIFDITADSTKNVDGKTMTTVYNNILSRYGESQWEVFRKITEGCGNIVVIKGDSLNLEIPTNKIGFGFIDGNHSPKYVENDFYLIWNKLSSGGAVAFHDYKWDLPQTTEKIQELTKRHSSEIFREHHDKIKHVLFVIKK